MSKQELMLDLVHQIEGRERTLRQEMLKFDTELKTTVEFRILLQNQIAKQIAHDEAKAK